MKQVSIIAYPQTIQPETQNGITFESLIKLIIRILVPILLLIAFIVHTVELKISHDIFSHIQVYTSKLSFSLVGSIGLLFDSILIVTVFTIVYTEIIVEFCSFYYQGYSFIISSIATALSAVYIALCLDIEWFANEGDERRIVITSENRLKFKLLFTAFLWSSLTWYGSEYFGGKQHYMGYIVWFILILITFIIGMIAIYKDSYCLTMIFITSYGLLVVINSISGQFFYTSSVIALLCLLFSVIYCFMIKNL